MKKIIEFSLLIILSIILIYFGRPKLAAFYYNQGVDCYDRHLYEEAIVSFRQSLKIDPSARTTHYMLGNAYGEKGQEAEAIEAYKKAIQINPRLIQAHQALVQMYWGNRMYQEALNQLKQTEVIFPDNQEIKILFNDISFEYTADYLGKGVDSFLAGDKQRAYILLNKAIEIKPDFVYPHYVLAYFYFSEHNYEEAERKLSEVAQINSQFWPAYKLLGDIYFEKGIYEKAITTYQAALALNSKDPTIYNDLGLALMELERYREAILYLEKALELQPGNLNIRYSLASVYRDEGMFEEAVSEYGKLVHYQPDYPNVHNDLGDIYRQQGKDKEALEEYYNEIEHSRHKLSADPNNVIVLNNLAYAFNGTGEYNKAKEVIEKALSFQPDYRQAYLALAKIYENLGNLDGALTALAKAKALSNQANFIDRDVARLKTLIKMPSVKINIDNAGNNR